MRTGQYAMAAQRILRRQSSGGTFNPQKRQIQKGGERAQMVMRRGVRADAPPSRLKRSAY